MKRTSFATWVSRDACPRAVDALNTNNGISRARFLNRRFIFLPKTQSVLLLPLSGRARLEAKCSRHSDPPSLRRLDENSLGDSARRRVFLRHCIAVGAVHDSGSYR